MAAETLAIIVDEAAPKGDVIAAARLAGIMAAKRTHELIPLCHPLTLTKVAVDIEADEQLPGLRITTEARLRGRTGVEMEALVAASVAALTVYDMCKAVDRGMEVTGVRLLEKSGGRSGHWRRDGAGEQTSRPGPEHPEEDRERPPGRRHHRLGQRRRQEGRAQAARRVHHPRRRPRRRGRRPRRALAPPGQPAGQREHREDAAPRARRRTRAPSARTSPPRASCVYELPVGTRFYARRRSCSRSPRSARCATTAARSSTRPATA